MNEKLDIVLSKFSQAKRSGKSWVATCPVCSGKKKISISEGRDSRILVKCWKGCDTEEILKSVGLSWKDIYRDIERNNPPPLHPARLKLNKKHTDELKRSGLTEGTIKASGIYSATTEETEEILGFPVGPGMAFPYPGETNEKGNPWTRVKPDNPPHYMEDPPKYLTAKMEISRGNRLYIPPGVEKILQDPGKTLYITEGEKKSLKLTQEGFPCIGLVGIHGGIQQSLLIECWSKILINDREFIIVPDSDRDYNPDIRDAVFVLATLLRQRGAKSVREVILPWPPQGGPERYGIDDFLTECGKDEFTALQCYEAACSTLWKLSKSIWIEFQRSGYYKLSTYDFKEKDFEELEAQFLQNKSFTRKLKYLDVIQKPWYEERLCSFTIHFTSTAVLNENKRIRGFILSPSYQDKKKNFEWWIRPGKMTVSQTLQHFITGTPLGGIPHWNVPLICAAAERFNIARKTEQVLESIGWHGDSYIMPSVLIKNGQVLKNKNCEILTSEDDSESFARRYDFKFASHQEVKEAVTFLLEKGLSFHDEGFLSLMVGIYALAPIHRYLESKAPVIVIEGETGEGKTTSSVFFLNFFGDFPLHQGVIDAGSTANAVEKIGFGIGDAVYLWDNLRPDSLPVKDFDRIINSYHDRTGRVRLKRDSSIMSGSQIRGLLILTANRLPTGGYAPALERRCLILRPPKGMLKRDLLHELNQNRAKLTVIFPHFIAWIQRKVKAGKINFKIPVPVVEAQKWGRQVSFGLLSFFSWIKEECRLPQEWHNKLDYLYHKAGMILDAAIDYSEERLMGEMESEVFIDCIQQMLGSRLICIGEPTIGSYAKRIGWAEGDEIFLYQKTAIAEVNAYLRKCYPSHPGLELKTLRPALRDAGILIEANNRPSVCKRDPYAKEKPVKVWVLKRDILLDSAQESSTEHFEKRLQKGYN